jgi:hypothetical protein
MTKHIMYFACILVLMAVTITSFAQDSGVAADLAANNTTANLTENNTTINERQIIAPESTAENGNNSASNNTTVKALGNTSPKEILPLDTQNNQTSRNLSTVDNTTIVVAPISDMAKDAPEVAAAASSVQVAYASEGALKLGNSEGGWNPFNPAHKDVEALKLDIATKPMRDTGRMFFVCDIV